MRDIFVTNSLTRKKDPLKSLDPDGKRIRMYACGVTVYDDCHIGHAMQAIFFDVIRNYLQFVGYSVTYVRNYTDVDDKIINRAKERGMSPRRLADDMIASSIRDMNLLGVKPADHEPKVSETMPQILSMIETLIANGAAYATKGGDVYYKVRAKADYGKLSNRNPEDMRSGTRDISGDGKLDELDFALWKADTTPDASWPSPWGQGRPGWHIECSAMARRYLGDSFEIHGGGRDLMFPHHENEIAQSESANKAPYASIWVHSGLLTIEHQKMSKSLGNHISIHEFLKSFPAEVLRLGFLQYHYGSNVDFSRAVFMSCHRRLLYYYETLAGLDTLAAASPGVAADTPNAAHPLMDEFHKAMSDDFNTAAALSAVNRHMRIAREWLTAKATPESRKKAADLAATARKIGGVLGLMNQPTSEAVNDLKRRLLPELKITEDEINAAIAARAAARQAKDYARSDQERDKLATRGIDVRDTPTGTTWAIRYQLED